MGNQSGKVSNEDDSLNTARCPQRNRNIRNVKNVKNEQHKNNNKETKVRGTFKENGNKNETVVRQKISTTTSDNGKSKKIQPTSIGKSNNKRQVRKPETCTDIRRKRQPKKNQNGEASKDIKTQKQNEENIKTINAARKNRQFSKILSRNSSKSPSQHEANLISDIFNTVAELESTFLDEKKYERRLRSAYSKQIESMQQLKLSLHIEKQRNKRLMELMNRYDSAETCTFKGNNNDTIKSLSLINQERPKLKEIELHDGLNHIDRSKWSYQHRYSNAMDTPISPMLMQQRYEELSKSYATCQSELKQKEKQLTLAHCKQEALQAKCDRLTEQFLASQRKIESLRRKHENLRKKTSQEQVSDSFYSDDSCLEDYEYPIEGSSKSALKQKILNASEDDENIKRIPIERGLENCLILEEQKLLPKTKAE